MSYFAYLAARAHATGIAQPRASVLHRQITENPICILGWQLGSEPYSPGAVAIGTKASGPKVFVPGYPMDRVLLFPALLPFAKEFCAEFEAKWQDRVPIKHKGFEGEVPRKLPQVLVPNRQTISFLYRLGRRLAYLPIDGPLAADPLLTRLGRHLMWLAIYSDFPGQQLIVPMTELLAEHYVTGASELEMASLAALNAWIDPGKGKQGFLAAETAERQAVGPLPSPADAQTIFDLMQEFRTNIGDSKDQKVIKKFIGPLHEKYSEMVKATWNLVWTAVDRERTRPVAPSVDRRVLDDRIAYAEHMQYMDSKYQGRRRARTSLRENALEVQRWQGAKALLDAEEAIDDPVRMAQHLLTAKALAGLVTFVDASRTERVGARNCKRPLVRIRTEEPCTVPMGVQLWWTANASGREWLVQRVEERARGSEVTLVLQTNRFDMLPDTGSRACFSIFNTHAPYEAQLPWSVPWTHKAPPLPETDLDGPDTGALAA